MVSIVSNYIFGDFMIFSIVYSLVKWLFTMYSETLELSWNVKPNRIEFFQYFDVQVRFDQTEFIKVIQMQ
jgi:cellulose synthase/poly-beta-1,6-N-acetylglucosamine synthase-like glycosyltransferase